MFLVCPLNCFRVKSITKREYVEMIETLQAGDMRRQHLVYHTLSRDGFSQMSRQVADK